MAHDYHNAATAQAQALAQQANQNETDLLKSFLMQKRQSAADAQHQEVAGQQQQQHLAQQGQQASALHTQDEQAKLSALDRAKTEAQANPDYDVTVEGSSYKKHRPEINPMQMLAYQHKLEADRNNKVDELSKRTQKDSSTYDAANQLETLTNTDGNGGILTNPNAKLKSFGSVASGVQNPTAIALAETTGMLPKGSQQERAAVQALVNDYAHKKYGARVTPEQMQREYIAHGLVPGADPGLAAKALRQRVRNIQSDQQAMEAGYTPDVQEQYHKQYTNPMSGLKIFDDNTKQAAQQPSNSKQFGSDEEELQHRLAVKQQQQYKTLGIGAQPQPNQNATPVKQPWEQ